MKEPKQLMVRVPPLADPALKGKHRVLREGSKRRHHTEDDGDFAVPPSPYYLRRLHLGELVLARPDSASKKGAIR